MESLGELQGLHTRVTIFYIFKYELNTSLNTQFNTYLLLIYFRFNLTNSFNKFLLFQIIKHWLKDDIQQ